MFLTSGACDLRLSEWHARLFTRLFLRVSRRPGKNWNSSIVCRDLAPEPRFHRLVLSLAGQVAPFIRIRFVIIEFLRRIRIADISPAFVAHAEVLGVKRRHDRAAGRANWFLEQ